MNSGPPKLVGNGGGDRNCFWRKGVWNQGFHDASIKKGQRGAPGEVRVAQAATRRGWTPSRARRAPGGCGPPQGPILRVENSSRTVIFIYFPWNFLSTFNNGKT